MDPSILRSRLSHAIDELHSLTTQDLIECKWPVIQRIFLHLFEESPCLREYSDRINDLTDLRNVELRSQRAEPEKRQEWKQRCAIFKTNFMRVVIDGLSYLRWPPSLVAFSDPLEKLLTDPKDAIAYILEIGIHKETTRHNRSRKDDLPATPSSASTRVNLGTSDEMSPQTRLENNSIDNGLLTQLNNLNFRENNSGHRKPTRPQSARRVDVTGNLDSKHSKSVESQHTTQADTTKTSLNMDVPASIADFKKLSHSFEILQHQNEVLSKQLKKLQESVYARDNAEAALGATLSNFKSQIQEIVSISKPDKNESLYRIPDITENNLLSPSIDEEFREEVRREKEHEKKLIEDMKNLSGYGKSVTSSRTKTFENRLNSTDVRSEIAKKNVVDRNSVPKGPTIIFSKLLEKLVRLEKEWIEAKSSITVLFSNKIELPNMCESFLRSNNTQLHKNRNGNGNGNGSKNRTDSINNNSGRDGGKNPGKNDFNDDLNQGGSLACTIRLHQVLGVRPPIVTVLKGIEGGHGGFTNDKIDGSQRHGLDLQRVHLLQRDLIRFSEDVFSFLSCDNLTQTRVQKEEKTNIIDKNKENKRDNGYSNNTDSYPCSTIEAEKQIIMLNLFRRAQDLMLHLSCIAPLAPLVLESPYLSSMTGIELLEKNIINIIPNLPGGSAVKAQAAVRLQGEFDRMKSEQINLLRCLQSSNSMLQQWTAAARKTSPLLTSFTRQSSDSFLASKQEISDLLDSVLRVTGALEAAEDAKVALPDTLPPLCKPRPGSAISGKGGIIGPVPAPGVRVISPLDSVSHGWLGIEMADLVNTLRMHASDLKRLPHVVEGMKKAHLSDNKAFLKEFEDAKKRVLLGAAATGSALVEVITSLPP